MTKAIDVTKRLNWVVDRCSNYWHVPVHLRYTARGVPYVDVNGSGVRIVIFAKTHKVRVFYTPLRTGIQEHMDFPMSNEDWVEMVSAFAVGAGMSHPMNS